jgi:hypothetical protein
MALSNKFSKHLHSDELQFGFKKGLSCSNALFALRQVVDYFTDRNSNVYIASLDASKAFDRVNHFKLFTTLIHTGVPKCFVDILHNWYLKLSIVVRWDNCMSSPLKVFSGVRQGGILSPVLFNIYANSFIVSLRGSKLGCHFHDIYLGCIMYADDILLLSSSVIELQRMLDMCSSVGNELEIKFNSAKSKCISIGPMRSLKLAPVSINGSEIQWVEKIKYLGLTLVAGKVFAIDLSETRRKFFVSVNVILSKCQHCSDIVKLNLVETHCLPVLLYGLDCLNLPGHQLIELNSWWNSVYRKIFGYHKWESVKELIFMLCRIDFYSLLNIRCMFFLKRLCINSCNSLTLSNLTMYVSASPECKRLFLVCNANMQSSFNQIKSVVWNSFQSRFSP